MSLTTVTDGDGNGLAQGWFIGDVAVGDTTMPTVWKDGALPTGYSSFVNFVQSSAPGTQASQAGVFVLANLENLNVEDIALYALAVVLDPSTVLPGTTPAASDAQALTVA